MQEMRQEDKGSEELRKVRVLRGQDPYQRALQHSQGSLNKLSFLFLAAHSRLSSVAISNQFALFNMQLDSQ
jgi:hypothetical protein